MQKSKKKVETSLLAKTPGYSAGGLGSIPLQGTRSHMLQLGVCLLQQRLKILSAETKTRLSQVSK